MSDDETKQLLREILAAQQEQLALAKRSAEHQSKSDESYVVDSNAYRQQLEVHSKTYWIAAAHSVTMAAVVGLLIYLVVHVLHSR